MKRNKIDGHEHYGREAVNCGMIVFLYVSVFLERSSYDALLFFKEKLEWCRSRPLVRAVRVPGTIWPLELL
jgi:transposase-like protein